MTASQTRRKGKPRYGSCWCSLCVVHVSCMHSINASMINILLHSQQDSKDGAQEEEEKQGENGKKEEEKGRETEGERESEKTDQEMGMYFSAAVFKHGSGKLKQFGLYQVRSLISP